MGQDLPANFEPGPKEERLQHRRYPQCLSRSACPQGEEQVWAETKLPLASLCTEGNSKAGEEHFTSLQRAQ